MASQKNLDQGVDDYFSGSVDEDVYGSVRLKPLIYQDDVLRSSRSVVETRNGNIKLNSAIKEKALEIHPTKSNYILVGSKEFKDSVEHETSVDPIMFGSIPLKRKEVVYLPGG